MLISKKIDFLFILLIILISSSSSTFVRSDYLTAILGLFLFLFSLFKSGLDSKFFLVLGFLIFFLVSELIFFGNFNLTAYIRLASMLIIVYVALHYIDDFWVIFEKIMYKLVILSLIIFPIQIFFSEQLLVLITPINNIINPSDIKQNFANGSLSMLIYTFHHTWFRDELEIRNSGFMWEPGGFAAMIIIAIVILYLRNGFKTTNLKRYFIYFAGIISTLSTTGFIALLLFFVIISFESYKLNIFKGVVLTLFTFVTFYFIIQLPFISDKIVHQYSNVRIAQVYNTTIDTRQSLGRFGSFHSGLITLKEYPLTGIGLDDNRRPGSIDEFNWTNGLIDYLLKFGIIGFIILTFNLYKSLIKIKVIHLRKTSIILLIIVFLSVLFSNPIALLPIFLALQFTYLFQKKHIGQVKCNQLLNENINNNSYS